MAEANSSHMQMAESPDNLHSSSIMVIRCVVPHSGNCGCSLWIGSTELQPTYLQADDLLAALIVRNEHHRLVLQSARCMKSRL